MHIRKLELQGFKSFVDRQTFHFGAGIAGVVGPNGCGKSNIVDAIRWCIGEQSARSLRGEQMQDVIFNGSAARRPVGLAEVLITFQAGDAPFPGDFARFEELQIGRRLYRDGTSEYLINQERVRRRDIVDFFLDTGIGNKLYSIIAQGEIGRIVAARPEERRGMLEEAAGISKYKLRREESEAQLNATTQNLERATDVAEEMGRRMRQLERQVEKATRFRRLRAQIRQGELFLGLVKYAGLSAERRDLTGELRAAREESSRLSRELERKDGDLKSRRDEIAVMSSVVNTLRDELAELEAQRREKESARHFHSREAEDLHKRQGIFEHDLDESSIAAQRFGDEADRAAEELAAARGELEGRDSEQRLSAERASTLGNRLHRLRGEVEEHKRVVMACITGLVRHRTQLGGVGQRDEELAERLLAAREESARVKLEIEDLRAALAEARAVVTGLEAKEVEARRTAELLAGESREAEAELNHLRDLSRKGEESAIKAERELAGLDARVKALADLLAANAGVEGGAKAVLSAVSCHGTLAAQLDVPAELEPAINAALGDALDYVLLRDEADLDAAVKRASAGGRVGLLTDGPGVEARGLAELLGGTELGKRALARLLPDCALFDTLDEALAHQRGTGGMAVTRRGELVQPGGAVLVGKAAVASGAVLLQRRRQLAELTEQLDALREAAKAKRDAAQSAARAVTEQQALVQRVQRGGESQRAAVQQASFAVSEARLKVRERERELAMAEQRQRATAAEEERVEQQRRKLRDESEQSRAAIAREETRQNEAEEALKLAQSELVRLEGDAAEARDEAARAQTLRSAARERAALVERGFTTARQRADEALARREKAELGLRQAIERQEALRSEQIEVEAAVRALGERQSEVGLKLQSERTRLEREREALAQLEEGLRDLRGRTEQATGKATRLELRLQELKLAIESLREQVEGRYSVSLPGLLDRLEHDAALVLEGDNDAPRSERLRPAEPVPELRVTDALLSDMDAVKKWMSRLDTLRTELAGLGEVNLAALEEFEDVAQRHEWLEKQRQDLEESVETIRRTIAKINRTCRERFRETFDRVNAEFRELYPMLVGGGQGRLTLTNEEDLLETGVDIFVQPPGKRLQNLSLLSGGEKAMCAIALIFALFKVKPSPFCILDEVDAPLDEGNGARFNDVLKTMVQLSQFIVITHNKKTMEAVDILYGVTMPEPGASRLVTVKVS